MLLAKDVVPVEVDFISVLSHIPGTKEEIQSYFLSRGIRVPRTSYEQMWEVLTERVQHGGAGSAVFECLRENMPFMSLRVTVTEFGMKTAPSSR